MSGKIYHNLSWTTPSKWPVVVFGCGQKAVNPSVGQKFHWWSTGVKEYLLWSAPQQWLLNWEVTAIIDYPVCCIKCHCKPKFIVPTKWRWKESFVWRKSTIFKEPHIGSVAFNLIPLWQPSTANLSWKPIFHMLFCIYPILRTWLDVRAANQPYSSREPFGMVLSWDIEWLSKACHSFSQSLKG